jgi:hypothetical protein
MNTFTKIVAESSLSRLWSHNEKYDCGALTAFRKFNDCGNGTELTNDDKKKRNLALAADLKSLGYDITKLIGKYPEGGTTLTEVSYFVVDSKESGNLKNDLIKLGSKYEQDSVLIVPKGSIKGEDKAYLIGTNDCPNNFLSKGETLEFDKGKLGLNSPIYTSYVGGRPFVFESFTTTETLFDSGFEALAASKWSSLIKGN